jgi:hypothetical protein
MAGCREEERGGEEKDEAGERSLTVAAPIGTGRVIIGAATVRERLTDEE